MKYEYRQEWGNELQSKRPISYILYQFIYFIFEDNCNQLEIEGKYTANL